MQSSRLRGAFAMVAVAWPAATASAMEPNPALADPANRAVILNIVRGRLFHRDRGSISGAEIPALVSTAASDLLGALHRPGPGPEDREILDDLAATIRRDLAPDPAAPPPPAPASPPPAGTKVVGPVRESLLAMLRARDSLYRQRARRNAQPAPTADERREELLRQLGQPFGNPFLSAYNRATGSTAASFPTAEHDALIALVDSALADPGPSPSPAPGATPTPAPTVPPAEADPAGELVEEVVEFADDALGIMGLPQVGEVDALLLDGGRLLGAISARCRLRRGVSPTRAVRYRVIDTY